MIRSPMLFFVALAAPACLAEQGSEALGARDGQLSGGDSAATHPSEDVAADTVAVDSAVADTAVSAEDTPVIAVDTAADSAAADSNGGTPDVFACLDDGGGCESDKDCCSGICTYVGPYSADSTCIAPLALGEYCNADHWCQSGHCVGGVCMENACVAAGGDCTWDARVCCAGLFCSWRGDYTPGYCTEPLVAGSPCADGSWCRSGLCSTDGVCQP